MHRLLRHGEWFAIAIAFLLGAVPMAAHLLTPEPADEVLARSLEDLADRVAAARDIPRLFAPPGDADDVRARFEAVPEGTVGPSWLAWKRPYVHVRSEAPLLPAPIHGAPQGLAGEAGFGAVRLTWSLAPAVRCRPARHEVWRTASADAARAAPGGSGGGWDLIATLDERAASYVDATAEPGRVYWYAVVSEAEALPGAAPFPPGGERAASAAAGPFVALREALVCPLTIDPPGRPGDPVTARAEVYAWNDASGTWSRRIATVHEGETLRLGDRDYRVDGIGRLARAEAVLSNGSVVRCDVMDHPAGGVPAVLLCDLAAEARLRAEIGGRLGVPPEEVRLTREEARSVQALWRPASLPGSGDREIIVEAPPLGEDDVHPVAGPSIDRVMRPRAP